MKCELRIISGARAGHREVFDKSYIGIGRHPLSDVRFDAERDLDASTRHAAIVRTGATWVLRDLGSTNGTFVNGEKLSGERPLHDGDTVRFGVHGPDVTFHMLRDEEEVVIEAVHAPAKPAEASRHAEAAHAARAAASARASAAPPPPPSSPSKTSVLRAELGAQRSRYRALAMTVLLIVVGAITVVVWQGRASSQALTGAQRTMDSLNAELAVLRRLRIQADSERNAIQASLRTEHDPARIRQMRTRLTTLTARSTAIREAQGVDYTAIRDANDRAVAIVYIRFPDSSTFAGTAFSVSNTGLMLTNRHVVISERGERPRDIAIQFSGSADVLPASLVRVSPDVDLAVIQLDSRGPFPAVLALGDASLVEGAPIALIGFPGAVATGTPHATLVTGSVTRAIPDSLYELDSFSGSGASGSPIFNRDGKVVGVEFGGLVGSGGRAILGLPIARARALLPH